MATLTKAELRDRILEHLVIKTAYEPASADDALFVDEAIDAAIDRLNKDGLVPFATSAIPAWAQIPLRDIVAIDVKPSFGQPVDRLPDGTNPIQNQAKAELHNQVAGYKHNRRTRAVYY